VTVRHARMLMLCLQPEQQRSCFYDSALVQAAHLVHPCGGRQLGLHVCGHMSMRCEGGP